MVKKNDRISDVVKGHPESSSIMMKHGVHCVGCHAALFETIEQGAKADGIEDEEIERMVDEINSRKKKNL